MNRAILITSHKNSSKALDHLIESLQLCPGIDGIDVIAVVGGHAAYAVEKIETCTVVRAPHNSIDFTGLLAVAVDMPGYFNYDSYFYLHDTTCVGPRFVKCVLALPHSLSTASFAFPSMNMGLYSRTVLEESKDLLETFRNTDESRAQQFKARCVAMEDCIFRATLALGPHHHFLSTGPPLLQGPPRDYYGCGVLRQVEYYPSVDVFKIKANWYVKSTYQLLL
jgi:hypothetical protein